MNSPARWALLPLLVALNGCMTLGPDYERPDVDTGAQFTEAPPGWKEAAPADGFRDDRWWELYQDPLLNALVEQLNLANPSIEVAEAQYRQALGLRRTAWSALFPSLSSTSEYTRSGRGSSGGQVATTGGGYVNLSSSSSSTSEDSSSDTSSDSSSSSKSSSVISENYNVSLSASWELDLWGKLRRDLEQRRASARASAADWASVRLSQQSQLVQSYMQLRLTDAQQRLLDHTVEAYARSLRLTENQYRAGIVPRSDVTQAEAQLKAAEADAIDLRWQRAQYLHAIAVLMGVPPSRLHLEEQAQLPVLPEIPVRLPSTLLERRPDIASAGRQVKAANAAMGSAMAAWVPSFSMAANGGYSSSQTKGLFTLPNRYWSLAPQATWSLFDFGAKLGAYDQARASHREAVANYRLLVLTGLQEVEDYLSKLQTLNREAVSREAAVTAARTSWRTLENQYRAGLVDYTSVVVQQTSALSSERTALTVTLNRLLTSVQLIAALGGGWDGNTRPVLED